MSNKKRFTVGMELTLNYIETIHAADEEQARELAYKRLKLIEETQQYTPNFAEANVDSVNEEYL